MPAQFNQVQTILSTIIKNWTAGNGGPPDLTGPKTHNTALFAWDTKANLLASKARNIPLIQPEIVGKPGLGHTANIVVALTVGVAPFPPMPDGGLDSVNGVFLATNSPEILTIIDWIEGGCQG